MLKGIKRLRVSIGLSQQEVADGLGITQASYARIEQGKTKLSSDRMEQLAKIFDVRPEYFISGSNDSPSITTDLSITNEYIKKIISLNGELREKLETSYQERIRHLENENQRLQEIILHRLK
ncbi:MAG: helix-turn-helix transcriptional regulator [Flavobacteriales bacterium]|nr:helix-turn-helix transcriptional regulator [Flavobacteriales bacterium]